MGQTQASKRLSAAAPIFELVTSPLAGGTFMGLKRLRWYKMDLAPVNKWPQQSWKGEFLDPRIGQEPMILSSPSQSPAGGASQLFWTTPGNLLMPDVGEGSHKFIDLTSLLRNKLATVAFQESCYEIWISVEPKKWNQTQPIPTSHRRQPAALGWVESTWQWRVHNWTRKGSAGPNTICV